MQEKKIGIIGGGQLGKMLIEEAIRYNVDVYTLDPDVASPAAPISTQHFVGGLKDIAAILHMAQHADVISFEIEHIALDALQILEQQGKTVIPSSHVLRIIQDKGKQKDFYRSHHIPTADYVIVQNKEEWVSAIQQHGLTRFAAKLCKEGYDGKGVVLCDAERIINQTVAIPFDAPTVLEKFVENAKEISIIVARDRQGNELCYPAVEMEFDPVANLVTFLFAPADIEANIEAKAQQIAKNAIAKMNGIGIFAVELFLDTKGEIWVNEIAPRPHNSGHHTIEACYTSQYEQLLRILLDKPLGSTEAIIPAAMLNVLGGTHFSGPYYLKGEDILLQTPGVYIHMYGKTISKPNRKLGHITVIGKTLDEVKEKAKFVLDNFSIEPYES